MRGMRIDSPVKVRHRPCQQKLSAKAGGVHREVKAAAGSMMTERRYDFDCASMIRMAEWKNLKITT